MTTNAPKRAKARATKSKIDIIIGLLKRPKGATLEQLAAATGWQAHSVRGAMSGTLNKKQGLEIGSEKTDGGRVYRIITVPA
ncbi:MAG: DUF3489 domain-containing protein [Rhizorhabdus sp.]|uniref:DUF3489 domain-containing protein n=1 Tax=Rhizorhabdus sp. TaxID=1968843 RepID=UPI001B4DBE54|nr:DUF3489 domain-containing protein [Rhizorhabdus sp.]MBP8235906.1 DUF3489 domain-containing protein [Rhizorhabdus sp.]